MSVTMKHLFIMAGVVIAICLAFDHYHLTRRAHASGGFATPVDYIPPVRYYPPVDGSACDHIPGRIAAGDCCRANYKGVDYRALLACDGRNMHKPYYSGDDVFDSGDWVPPDFHE